MHLRKQTIDAKCKRLSPRGLDSCPLGHSPAPLDNSAGHFLFSDYLPNINIGEKVNFIGSFNKLLIISVGELSSRDTCMNHFRILIQFLNISD